MLTCLFLHLFVPFNHHFCKRITRLPAWQSCYSWTVYSLYRCVFYDNLYHIIMCFIPWTDFLFLRWFHLEISFIDNWANPKSLFLPTRLLFHILHMLEILSRQKKNSVPTVKVKTEFSVFTSFSQPLVKR